jgi:hypothetical protein
MALEGNVKDFGLSEILQLIALQKKTGMLSITGERTLVIFFRDGQVISTRDRRRMADDPLKLYLLNYGFLSAGEMNRIQQIQLETNLDLTDILISEKLFSDDELRIIYTEQIQETIQEILSWPKSQYKFMIGSQVLQGVKSFGSLKVEGLLMESMRRIDEFPELTRIFTTEKTIVRSVDPADGAPPEMDELEDSVHAILAKPMSIAALIAKARMARFCTYEVLKNLLEKGLLQIVEVPAAAEAAAEEPVVEDDSRGGRSPVPAIAAGVLLAACLALGEFGVPLVLSPGWSLARRGVRLEAAVSGTAVVAPTLDAIQSRRLEAAVREALEEHLALTGAYPADLEALVSKGILPEEVLAEARELGLTYRVKDGGRSYSYETARR